MSNCACFTVFHALPSEGLQFSKAGIAFHSVTHECGTGSAESTRDRSALLEPIGKSGAIGHWHAGHLGNGVPDPQLIDPIERSEEHTSELQSLAYLVCRLL